MKVMEAFSEATGDRLSRVKSTASFVGPWTGGSEMPGGFSLRLYSFKILGVTLRREGRAEKD